MPAGKSKSDNKMSKSDKKKSKSDEKKHRKRVEKYFDKLMELMALVLMLRPTRQYFMAVSSCLNLVPDEVEDMQPEYKGFYKKFHALLQERPLDEEQMMDLAAILSNRGDEITDDEEE